jgi:hypothetical protein
MIKCLNKKCRENLYDCPPFETVKCPYCGLGQLHGPE